ncbi:MAG: SGNH/GDSL hydrolase family protein [Flavobacteriales bacterium]|nr:SGNH/GDSL hydrolase family protein [Flavobacteriales bacterium]
MKRWIFSFLFFFLLLEIGLRITGQFNSYSEDTGAGYVTYYGKTNPTWYHTWTPGYEIAYDQSEFDYTYMANSLGLREKEMALTKPDSVFRLICIGDSFTEGDGAEYEDAYPRFLEKKLNAEADSSVRYEVYNAGVCGSDMFSMNTILRDKLFAYHPDAVIFLINNSDVNDIIFRGGKERFLADGSSKFRSAPWYQSLYRFSHVARLVLQGPFGVDGNTLLPEEKMWSERKKAVDLIAEQIKSAKKMCADHGVKCAFVVQPVPTGNFPQLVQDVISNPMDASGTERSLQLIAEQMPSETALIKKSGMHNTLLPLVRAYANLELEEYAWPLNGHFNANGYRILAEEVYKEALLSDSTFFFRHWSAE